MTTLPEQTTDAPAKTEDVENQQPNAEQEIAEDAPQEEQGPTEMTLDEFRKQENRKKTENAFNVRQAGEGCDNSQWKKTFVLKKKVEESDEEEEEDEVRSWHDVDFNGIESVEFPKHLNIIFVAGGRGLQA